MRRTSVSALLVLALIGGVLAGLVQTALAGSGRAVLVAPVTLPIALAAIGAIVIVLALPIRRMTRGPRRGAAAAQTATAARPGGDPVDPFYATRVVMLAKASALTGALLSGVGAGMLVYLLSRSVVPGVGSVASAALGLVGAIALLVCGLVAEHMCRIPPRDEDDDPPRSTG